MAHLHRPNKSFDPAARRDFLASAENKKSPEQRGSYGQVLDLWKG